MCEFRSLFSRAFEEVSLKNSSVFSRCFECYFAEKWRKVAEFSIPQQKFFTSSVISLVVHGISQCSVLVSRPSRAVLS